MTPPLPAAPDFGTPIDNPASPDMLRFLARRRSTSAMSLNAPAPSMAEVDQLLRIAARVPDHGKLTPWRFIVLEGSGKAAFAAALDGLALRRGDSKAAAKLGKLKAPPLCIAVIHHPKAAEIPAWEQQLSVGAVCATLLYATQAMGYGANWITDWYAYDEDARTILGLTAQERVAGFILIGTHQEIPLERERPNMQNLVTVWSPPTD